MPPTRAAHDPVRLKLIDDKGFEKIVLLDADRLAIGSHASCDLVVPGHEGAVIAPRHAVVQRQGDGFILTDESGPRGTRVNGRPIRTTMLKHGDEISLGTSTLRIQFLVEGTRASDLERKRLRILLAVLHELHSSVAPKEQASRMAGSVMLVFDSEWTTVMMHMGGAYETVTTGSTLSRGLDAGQRLARQVAATGRSSFSANHLCVAVPCGEIPAGAIETGPRRQAPYQAADLEILEALASHLGIALLNARRIETMRRESASTTAGRNG